MLALTALGSLFSTSMSVANTVSYNTLKDNMNNLQQDMGAIKQQIAQQQMTLMNIGKMLDDTIVLVNMHSKLLNSTVNQVQILTHALNEERTVREPIHMLTHDLLREVGLGIHDLTQG